MAPRDPQGPKPPTDNERLLAALEAAYPEPVWDCNSRLMMTTHSRAADLRKQGHDVRKCRMVDAEHPKGARWGYRLVKPDVAVDADGIPVLFTQVAS